MVWLYASSVVGAVHHLLSIIRPFPARRALSWYTKNAQTFFRIRVTPGPTFWLWYSKLFQFQVWKICVYLCPVTRKMKPLLFFVTIRSVLGAWLFLSNDPSNIWQVLSIATADLLTEDKFEPKLTDPNVYLALVTMSYLL